jgi:hypothetical protein
MSVLGLVGGLLKYVAYGAGGLASVALVLLVTFQEKLVYVPVIPGQPREYPYTPDRLGLDYEDVWLRAADGTKLHGWFIRASTRLRSEPVVTGEFISRPRGTANASVREALKCGSLCPFCAL